MFATKFALKLMGLTAVAGLGLATVGAAKADSCSLGYGTPQPAYSQPTYYPSQPVYTQPAYTPVYTQPVYVPQPTVMYSPAPVYRGGWDRDDRRAFERHEWREHEEREHRQAFRPGFNFGIILHR